MHSDQQSLVFNDRAQHALEGDAMQQRKKLRRRGVIFPSFSKSALGDSQESPRASTTPQSRSFSIDFSTPLVSDSAEPERTERLGQEEDRQQSEAAPGATQEPSPRTHTPDPHPIPLPSRSGSKNYRYHLFPPQSHTPSATAASLRHGTSVRQLSQQAKRIQGHSAQPPASQPLKLRRPHAFNNFDSVSRVAHDARRV